MTFPNTGATATDSGTSQSIGAPNTTISSGAQDTGFRYTAGPGIPDYLVGKTPLEAATLADQMYRTLSSNQRPPQPVQTYGQPYVPPTPQSTQPSNDEWLTDPNAAFNRAMGTVQQNQFAPVIEQMAQANAANAKALAEQRYGDDFRRFGPEIHMELNRVPVQMQTFDNIRYVVDLVRGRHASELANELAEQRIQERMASGTLRPVTGGDGGVALTDPSSVDFSQLPEGYQAILERNRTTPRDLDVFLRKYYGEDVNLPDARKAWFENAKRGNVIVESVKGAGYRRES